MKNFFPDSELRCKCCGLLRLHPGFMDKLNGLREEFGRPMTPNSCCRCKKHNASIPGHPNSLHVADFPAHAKAEGALAIDIHTPDGEYRGALFALAWKRGWSIGWNAKKNFLHLDRRIDIGMPQTSFDY